MTEIQKHSSAYSCASDNSLTDVPLEWKRPSKWFLGVASFMLLFVSTSDTILAKLMNKQIITTGPDRPATYFEGPIWQTFISYILEAMMIFIYLYDSWKAKKAGKKYNSEYVHLFTQKESFIKAHCPFYYWAIPSLLDVLTSLGVNFALVFIHASTLQLLRNFNIVVTAFLSLFMVRVAFRIHQILGVVITTAGLIVISIQEFLNPDEETNNTQIVWLGMLIAILATVANAVQVVVEERLYRKYHASPYEAMGWFGIFGLIACIIIYIIGEFVPWNLDKFSEIVYIFKENSSARNMLILTSCLLMTSIAVFNCSGMIVTKFGSCLLRMILISARTITIWLVELIIQWNTFGPIAFCGMLITLCGIATYNYNYIVKPGAWAWDKVLRKPWVFASWLTNPDHLQVEDVQMDAPVAKKVGLDQRETQDVI